MSRPTAVVKETQAKPNSSFALVYLYSQPLHVDTVSVWLMVKQQWKLMGPASEAGGLIDYSLLYSVGLFKR